MKFPSRKFIKKMGWSLVVIFLIMNAVAFVHAYKFTHFSASGHPPTKDPKALSFVEKITTLLSGVDNPKPYHTTVPAQAYRNITIGVDHLLQGWYITVPKSNGTVVLFHGYAGEMSSLITRSDEFLALGYNTLLIDFQGAGESEGNSTSVGYQEADQVKRCYDYVSATGEKQIYLFGTSMGAVAILKAIRDYDINPSGIVLECPFGSLYKTVCARFKMMGVPSFPMAGLLAFWGGVQNGYWAFAHNPAEYARAVHCPTLLMYGEKDERVSREETNAIYKNLQGYKVLKTYPAEGHLFFTPTNSETWKKDVATFLTAISDLSR